MNQETIRKSITEITTELDCVHATILAKYPHDEAGVPAIENQDLANAVGAIERARVGLTELAYRISNADFGVEDSKSEMRRAGPQRCGWQMMAKDSRHKTSSSCSTAFAAGVRSKQARTFNSGCTSTWTVSRKRSAWIGPRSISSRRSPGSWWSGAKPPAGAAPTGKMQRRLLELLANLQVPYWRICAKKMVPHQPTHQPAHHR